MLTTLISALACIFTPDEALFGRRHRWSGVPRHRILQWTVSVFVGKKGSRRSQVDYQESLFARGSELTWLSQVHLTSTAFTSLKMKVSEGGRVGLSGRLGDMGIASTCLSLTASRRLQSTSQTSQATRTSSRTYELRVDCSGAGDSF